MAAPAWLIAGAKNPVVQTVGLSLAGGIYDLINPDEQRQIQRQVLDDAAAFQRGLLRQSRGRFTAQEREAIRRNSEAQVNAVAGNVAQRGLGTSPAGAAIVAQAQQAPYFAATQQAASQIPAVTSMVSQLAQSMGGNRQFHQLLGSIGKSLSYLRESEAYSPKGQEDPDDIVRRVIEILTGNVTTPAGTVPSAPPPAGRTSIPSTSFNPAMGR